MRAEIAGGGFIEVVDKLGSDETVVNSARVSFGKKTQAINENDRRLLAYLADNNHTSPFRHCYVQLHVRAPEFVARQWYKHIVGSEYSFKDQPWNEISGRYVEYDQENYLPSRLRAQAKDKKQGSSDAAVEDEAYLRQRFADCVGMAVWTYEYLLSAGVAKEQARMVLPLTFFTEWYWTASLQAIQHFVKLRSDPHAQEEIREYAQALDGLVTELFPNAWKALNGTHRRKAT